MIEYLYDAVCATAGEDISITAQLDNCGEPYTSGCYLTFYDDEGPLTIVEGLYVPELGVWSFNLPAEDTVGLSGRYWYEISGPDMSLNFKKPIYLK